MLATQFIQYIVPDSDFSDNWDRVPNSWWNILENSNTQGILQNLLVLTKIMTGNYDWIYKDFGGT